MLAAEVNRRMQAVASGERLDEKVGFRRGSVTTLDNAEYLLEIAVERVNATETTIGRLRAGIEQAEVAHVEAEQQRDSDAQHVHKVNQTLFHATTARHEPILEAVAQ